MSAEKCRTDFVGREDKLTWHVKLTILPAVFALEESVQFGTQIQLAPSSLIVFSVPQYVSI